MVNFYIDTSAFVKRYFLESGSDIIDRLFKKSELTMTASLTYAETYAAFNRVYREGGITGSKLKNIIELFEEDWKGLSLIEFSAEARKKIPDLSKKFPLRGADLLHLASALTIFERGIDFQFVASDGKLLNAAEGSGLPVLDPAKP